MTLNKNLNETQLTIALEGRLDTTTAPELETELKASLDSADSLIFDLDELEYISFAGLRVLLSAQKIMNKKGGISGTAAGIVSHGADVEMTSGCIQASSEFISTAEEKEEREGTAYCIYNADGRLTISDGELRGRLFSSGRHTIVGGAQRQSRRIPDKRLPNQDG